MSCIYVLRCANNSFYIGRTIDIVQRFNSHRNGFGSQWTKAHKVDSIVELIPDGPFQELVTTLQYMSKYGTNNVRGGPWCQLTLGQSQLDTIRDLLASEGFKRPPEDLTVVEATETLLNMANAEVAHMVAANIVAPNTIVDTVAPLKAPSKHNQIWTDEEISRLRDELGQGIPLDTIASNHQRTANAIRARVGLIIRQLNEQGLSGDQISRDLNLTTLDVQSSLSRRAPSLTSYLNE